MVLQRRENYGLTNTRGLNESWSTSDVLNDLQQLWIYLSEVEASQNENTNASIVTKCLEEPRQALRHYEGPAWGRPMPKE